MTTGIIKILLTITRNKKKKDDKIFMLAKNKLNSIETLIPQALIDLQISHEEFKTIASEKEKYEKMKEGIRMMKSSDELNGNNKSIRKIMEMRKIKIIIYFFSYIKCLELVLKHGKNGMEVIVEYNSTLWLNEKHIEEKLGHTNLPVITNTYDTEYKKRRFELVDQLNNQPDTRFLPNDLALKVIMDHTTDESSSFKRKL